MGYFVLYFWFCTGVWMGIYSQSVKILVQECDALLLQFVNVSKILMLVIIIYWLSRFWLYSFSFWMEYNQDSRGYIYLLLGLKFCFITLFLTLTLWNYNIPERIICKIMKWPKNVWYYWKIFGVIQPNTSVVSNNFRKFLP